MCGIDRVWFPHTGVFPGSQLSLPFQCPVDHVIEIQSFVTRKPTYPVLEHSFLNNTRVSDEFKQSKVLVKLGVDLQLGSTDKQVVEQLGKYSEYKVLKLDAVVLNDVDSFGGFEDEQTNTAFEQRLMTSTGVWGTAKERPGHVHYDFFADRAPWKDRHLRYRTKPWTLVGGENPFPE